MRTDAPTYSGTVSAGAQAVVDTYPAAGILNAYTYSVALSNAVQDFVNDFGPDGLTNEADIFLTARNQYASTICDYLEFTLTHDLNTQASWDSLATM